MAPKARLIKIGRPKYVTEARVANDPNEVCIGVSHLATQKDPIWHACHRDDHINVLYRKLRSTLNIEDKELRKGEFCISRYSDLTFRQVIPDSEDIAEFIAVLPNEESPFDDRISKDEQNIDATKSQHKKSYASNRRRVVTDTAIELYEQASEKPRHIVEEIVHEAIAKLHALRSLLCQPQFEGEQAKDWLNDIDNILPQAITPPTIIGVVGDTGSGKSSMLNALLDQEVFIPTSSHRACTATITEISYNKISADFRAVVDFIDAATWNTEVRYLYDDQKTTSKSKYVMLSDILHKCIC